jgi:hypothetical protein
VACRTGGAECARGLSFPRSPSGPSLRFSSPLIEPDVQISCIRLSDGFHEKACANTNRNEPGIGVGRQHAQLPEDILHGKLPVARAGDLVPPTEKAPDRVIQMQHHRVPRFRHRTV